MKKLICILLCVALIGGLLTGLLSVSSEAAGDDFSFYDIGSTGETRNEDVVNGNSYNRYGHVVRNYLRAVNGGYMRLYGCDNGTVFVEYYTSGFSFVGNRYIDMGLPMFGGFYESKDYYFVVSGQRNPTESDSVEVVRVTRFDKDWTPRGYDSIYGGNTTVPFIGGQCAFAEYDGHLIIRSAHEMYRINGNIHQANFTMVVNIDTMKITRKHTAPAHILTAGYLSHSLNQFVAVDTDGSVICLDHGDAYPRAAALGRFRTKANALVIYDNNYQTYDYTELIQYYGLAGENITGAMIGGLECSDSAYITVGAATVQNADYHNNRAYNAYITVTEKASDISKAKTTLTYLTSFKESDKRYASNPRLVKINSDRFLVMWNEFPTAEYVTGLRIDYSSSDYRMKYLFIDGKGQPTSEIMTAPDSVNAFVGGCEPILDGNRIMWYISDGEQLCSIIIMDFSGRIRERENIVPADLFQYPIDLSEAHTVFLSFDKLPANTSITPDNYEKYVAPVYQGKALVRGRDYELSESNPIKVTTADGYIRTIELNIVPVTGYSYFPLRYSYNWSANDYTPRINSLSREDGGVKLNVGFYRGVGVNIYRSENSEDGPYTMVGSIDDRSDSSYTDNTASPYKEYFYILKEYTFDAKGNKLLSEQSTAKSTPAVAPEPTVDPDAPVILGDSDCDGELTILDATAIQRFLVGYQPKSFSEKAADSDRDGEVTILDATSIQRFLASLPTDPGLGRPIGS